MSNSISGPSQAINPLAVPLASAAAPSVAPPAAGSQQAAAPARPQWLAAGVGTGTNFDMLGLPAPRSNGDLAALLSQVSLALEQTNDESRKSGALAKLAALASQLTSFDQTALGAAAERATAARMRDQVTESSLITATDPLIAQRESASTPHARADIDLQLMQAHIASLDRQLADLNAALSAATSDAERATINSRITATTSERAALDTSRSNLSASVATLRGEIATATSQLAAEIAKPPGQMNAARIASLSSAIATSSASLNSTYQTLATTAGPGVMAERRELHANTTASLGVETQAQEALNTASLIAVTLSRILAMNYQASQATEVNETQTRERGVDTAFANIADALKDLAARQAAATDARASNEAAGRKAAEERLVGLAAAIVSALANIVSVLANAGALAAADPVEQGAPAQPRPRTRIDA